MVLMVEVSILGFDFKVKVIVKAKEIMVSRLLLINFLGLQQVFSLVLAIERNQEVLSQIFFINLTYFFIAN